MTRRNLEEIEVDRIFLYEENPRHEPLSGQDEIIKYLCKGEQVFNLARSIAQVGPNPLELLGVVQVKGSGRSSTKKNYEVWEGNRRVCAILLLNDPDRAPAHLRKDFARLVSDSDYSPIKKINAVVFEDYDELKHWMAIIHGGQQDGIGRKNWDSQQKERHVGTGRNKVALAVLDVAEGLGLITKDDRNGKLTTAQRYLNNSVVREAIGIDASNKEDITYNRPLKDLKTQLNRFISDLKQGAKVTSRSNKDQIEAYGRKLARNIDISGERIQPLSLAGVISSPTKKQTASRRKKITEKDHLTYDKALAEALEGIRSDKLESLYNSITSVRLAANTPLLTIGTWAFVESLAALAGKNPNTDFVAYFSKNRLNELGVGNGKNIGPIHDALVRIQRNGNATKHHEISASFEGKQLNNDLATISPVLIKTLERLTTKK